MRAVLLDSSRKLQIKMAEVKTTNEMDVTCNYTDSSATAVTASAPYEAQTNGITLHDILPAPSAGVIRNAMTITVVNNDTISHTFYIYKVGGSPTPVLITEQVIAVGAAWDSNIAAGGGGGITYSGTAPISVSGSAITFAPDGLTAKATPVAADEVVVGDSAASFAPKKSTFTQIMAQLGIWLDAFTAKTTPVGADEIAVADSAASNASKKVTLTNLFAQLGVLINAFTAKTTPVDADVTNIGDSAASFASKMVTLSNLWLNYLKGKADALYMALVAPGANGNVLTSNGSAWTSAAPSGGGGGGDPAVADGRLTLTTATPVTTADVTGATTIYYTPYKGNSIGLYDGSSAWTILTFTEKSLALGTLTSGLTYDVFAYNNSGVVALELLAWSTTTARATALVYQNGVLVKSGATTRRYLGTFYTTSTTQTEDSQAKRFLYNYYNRTSHGMSLSDGTSHSYTTTATRIWNNNSADKIQFVVGVIEEGMAVGGLSGMGGAIGQYYGVGINSTSTMSFIQVSTPVTATANWFIGGTIQPGGLSLGYNYLAALEYGAASATQGTAYLNALITM